MEYFVKKIRTNRIDTVPYSTFNTKVINYRNVKQKNRTEDAASYR
jgi:hypothetical protein